MLFSKVQDISVKYVLYKTDNRCIDLLGHVDSNWSVGAVLEKKLNPLPFTLALSGLMNHNKGQFRLGVGVIIG